MANVVGLISGTASQSSTVQGSSAGRAVNGDTSQSSCTQTRNTCDSWWKLALGKLIIIEKVQIWLRNGNARGAQVKIDDQLCGTITSVTKVQTVSCGTSLGLKCQFHVQMAFFQFAE